MGRGAEDERTGRRPGTGIIRNPDGQWWYGPSGHRQTIGRSCEGLPYGAAEIPAILTTRMTQ